MDDEVKFEADDVDDDDDDVVAVTVDDVDADVVADAGTDEVDRRERRTRLIG